MGCVEKGGVCAQGGLYPLQTQPMQEKEKKRLRLKEALSDRKTTLQGFVFFLPAVVLSVEGQPCAPPWVVPRKSTLRAR